MAESGNRLKQIEQNLLAAAEKLNGLRAAVNDWRRD
jgi:hypothetical protein